MDPAWPCVAKRPRVGGFTDISVHIGYHMIYPVDPCRILMVIAVYIYNYIYIYLYIYIHIYIYIYLPYAIYLRIYLYTYHIPYVYLPYALEFSHNVGSPNEGGVANLIYNHSPHDSHKLGVPY